MATVAGVLMIPLLYMVLQMATEKFSRKSAASGAISPTTESV